MADAKRLNLILAVAAGAILIVSFGALAYTFVPLGDSDIVTINSVDFAWADIFDDYEAHGFRANDVSFEGVHLAELVLDSGVQNPEAHNYRLIGQDHYQKDVTWNDIQNGYLTLEKHRAVFPGLSQSFWVRDLASIEVV
jgi:hypothetical protein